MITLTINGRKVQAEAGMTVIQVADANGIRIPRLCYHKALSPIGSCRLCVVEVKPGPPRPQPACTTPVADKMEVTTHSAALDHYRRQVLQLLLVNHPLDCPICDKGGECELQQLTRELKIGDQPYQAVKLIPEFDDGSPLIERYPDRCVNCERCVRICRDWVGAAALYFDNRGYRTRVTAGGKQMDCEFCGSCIGVCPVGAIVDKTFRHQARSWQLEQRRVICPYCGGGCHLFLNTRDGRLKRVTGRFDEPVNSGVICSRGRFAMDFVHHPERLTQPLLRKNGELTAVSWDEALAFAAGRLLELRERYGAEAVGGIGSPRVSNEANYLLQKCLRLGLGTPNLDATTSLDHQQALRALREVLGRPLVKRAENGAGSEQRILEVSGFQLAFATLEELRQADTVLVLGADLKKEAPPFGWQINQAQKAKSLKNLMIVSPRRTRFRSRAQWNGTCRPGSDGLVLQGLLKALLARAGSEPPAQGEFRGRKRLGEHLEKIGWDQLERLSGLARADFERLAVALESSKRPVLVIGCDLMGLTNSTRIVQYVADLLLFLGKILKVLLTADKANTQGCSDMGVSPWWLPGYVPLDQPEAVERVWGRRPAAGPGLDLMSMLEGAAAGTIKGLWVMGSDLIAACPDRSLVERGLRGLDLLVSQEVFLNQTARLAHCVLPALSLIETPGTITAADLRVQRQDGTAFISGPRPDWDIVQDLDRRLGGDMNYADAAAVFDEIARVIPNYHQYRLPDIPAEGFHWSRLYRAKYGSGAWKRKLDPTLEMTIPELDPPPRPSAATPFLLMVGKSLFQSGTLGRYGRGPNELEPAGCLTIHPLDGERLGLQPGDRVELSTPDGSVQAPCAFDHRVPLGVVQATLHFSDLPIGGLLRRGSLCPASLTKAGER